MKTNYNYTRVLIENVKPEVDDGRYPIKRVIGEVVEVEADIFTDGHDLLSAVLRYQRPTNPVWQETPMLLDKNDRWTGKFTIADIGLHRYTIIAWIDHFGSWQHDLKKRVAAAQDVRVHLQVGAQILNELASQVKGSHKKELLKHADLLVSESDPESSVQLALSPELTRLAARYPDRRQATAYEKELTVWVERKKALFSSWYECFPRSCAAEPGKHGTLADCRRLLPELARMGFDVFYLPPIHPIGKTNRKGKNNQTITEPGDVGCPWAIGGAEGGHKSIHPDLGTMQDFSELVSAAEKHGIEIALDLALQCAPDHPYVKEHPEWFKWLPDGTVQYAENPPKKYQDVLPINFDTEQRQELWEELKSIVLFWAGHGVRIFRVDNPHTKPIRFWEWMTHECRQQYPDLIFLSEAFTRPKVMYALAKVGFSQSYTYFTWRNTKIEFIKYMTELSATDVRDFFRPNFWPNTPDILPEHLQYGGRPCFITRLILAATLSSNYGIYGPPFELCIAAALPGKEEYADSEKYEVRFWNCEAPGNLRDIIARVNKIRSANPALQSTWNIRFHEADNDQLIVYSKATADLSNIILVIVNLDPYHVHSGWVTVPLEEFGIDSAESYMVHDLLSDEKYIWQGEKNYVKLDPQVFPAHVLRVNIHLKRESDFDYFF